MITSSANAVPACRWCGKHHDLIQRCPEVKAFEYHPNGTVKRVEFYSPNDYAPMTAPVWQPSPSPGYYPKPWTEITC